MVTFWAAALGYDVEFPTGSQEEKEFLARFPGIEGTAGAISDPTGEGPRFYFQKVPEPKTVKNRVHVDVRVGDVDAAVTKLCDLGGRVLERDKTNIFDEVWTIMADPEGNEFCVTELKPEV